MVPATNCRIVRPREMRARKRPTKEAQATHHAQKNRVHRFIHSLAWSKAIVFNVRPGNEATKSPTFITTPSTSISVRPVTSTQPASDRASSTLSWDRNRMPLSTPVVAEMAAMTTAIVARAICAPRPTGTPKSSLSPMLRKTTPIPRLVATPNTVPRTAAVSTAWPRTPSIRRPKMG